MQKCYVYAMFICFTKSLWKVYEKCPVYEKFMQHLKSLWNINFVYDLATLIRGRRFMHHVINWSLHTCSHLNLSMRSDRLKQQ